MKIAHVVWFLQMGGIETMLVNIINAQVEKEDVTLYIINDSYSPSLLNNLSPRCKVRMCHRHEGSYNPWPLIKLNYWLWRCAPDIVHVHSYKLSDVILNRRHMVRTIHSTRNNSREYPRMKALYAISDAVRKSTLQQGFESVVVENGIPCKRIRKKHNYQVENNCYQLVQVSRLDISQKGQDILIGAIEELVNHRGVKNVHMHFIGEGESEIMLKQMVDDMHLKDYITFEGTKTQEYIFTHLCEYDCFIQPSRYEGFGLTVAEAMASGLPVLVSNIEGPLEIIENGRLGMTFQSENVIDLADKLEVILKGKYDYKLIDKAYEHVRERYDVSVTARKYIEEYKKILV